MIVHGIRLPDVFTAVNIATRSITNRFSGGGEKWTDDALIELNDRIYFDESEKG